MISLSIGVMLHDRETSIIMVMTMATISSLWEGISPVDFSLPESFSLSGVLRPAEAAVSNSEPPLT
jgi:hypothetical protein